MRVNKGRCNSLINQNSTNSFHNQKLSPADNLLRVQRLHSISMCNNDTHASSSYREKENGDEIIGVDLGMPYYILIVHRGNVSGKKLHLKNYIPDDFTNMKLFKKHISTIVEVSETFNTNESRHLHLNPPKVKYL